jgi:hypothetical protein
LIELYLPNKKNTDTQNLQRNPTELQLPLHYFIRNAKSSIAYFGKCYTKYDDVISREITVNQCTECVTGYIWLRLVIANSIST